MALFNESQSQEIREEGMCHFMVYHSSPSVCSFTIKGGDQLERQDSSSFSLECTHCDDDDFGMR